MYLRAALKALFEEALEAVIVSDFITDIYRGKFDSNFVTDYRKTLFEKEETLKNSYKEVLEKVDKLYANSDLGCTMNNYGREHCNDYSGADQEIKELYSLVKELFKIFRVPKEMVLYRLIGVNKGTEIVKSGCSGKHIVNDGCVSTSTNPLIPLLFMIKKILENPQVEFDFYFLIIRNTEGLPCVPFGNDGKLLKNYKGKIRKLFKKCCNVFYREQFYKFKNLSEQEVLLPNQIFNVVDHFDNVLKIKYKKRDKNRKLVEKILMANFKIFLVNCERQMG